jgi:hypothetical protein
MITESRATSGIKNAYRRRLSGSPAGPRFYRRRMLSIPSASFKVSFLESTVTAAALSILTAAVPTSAVVRILK